MAGTESSLPNCPAWLQTQVVLTATSGHMGSKHCTLPWSTCGLSSLMPNGPHTGPRIWENKTTLMCSIFCLSSSVISLMKCFWSIKLWTSLGHGIKEWQPGWEGISTYPSLTPSFLGLLPVSLSPTTHLRVLFAPGSEEPPEAQPMLTDRITLFFLSLY